MTRSQFRFRSRFTARLVRRSLLAATGCAAMCGAGAASGQSPDAKPTLTFRQFVPGQPLRLVVYGDMRFTDPSVTSGTNPRVRKWLAERVGEEHPAALLLTGDMPYMGGGPADWDEFQKETVSWRTRPMVVLPTIGNHELRGNIRAGIENYLRNFPDIEGHRYYSALLGSVEVISLDMSSGAGPRKAQSRWFAAQLAHVPGQVQFLFILEHLPWVVDAQTEMLVHLPNKETLFLRGILDQYLPRLHARVMVVNGHIHNYERFERNGVEYVVSGGGGAQPYPILYRGSSDLYKDAGFPVYHYLTVEVRGDTLHAVMWKVKDPDVPELSVEQKDEFTLTAPAAKSGSQPSPNATH